MPSRHGDVADDPGELGQLVSGQLNGERLASFVVFKEDSAHGGVDVDLNRLFGEADDCRRRGPDVHKSSE